MNNDETNNPMLTEDLRALEESLDALGKLEQQRAPRDVGDRIAAAFHETTPLKLQMPDGSASGWRQHLPLAASVALLVVAGVLMLIASQSMEHSSSIAESDAAIADDWIEFETTYAAESLWDGDIYESLQNELAELESSIDEPWTLDENLNLTDGESL